MNVITMPQSLVDKLGKDGANAFVEILGKVQDSAKEVTLEVAESRFEKHLSEFETKIERRLSDFKTDIIKWMIGIAISQMVLILTIISLLIRK